MSSRASVARSYAIRQRSIRRSALGWQPDPRCRTRERWPCRLRGHGTHRRDRPERLRHVLDGPSAPTTGEVDAVSFTFPPQEPGRYSCQDRRPPTSREPPVTQPRCTKPRRKSTSLTAWPNASPGRRPSPTTRLTHATTYPPANAARTSATLIALGFSGARATGVVRMCCLRRGSCSPLSALVPASLPVPCCGLRPGRAPAGRRAGPRFCCRLCHAARRVLFVTPAASPG